MKVREKIKLLLSLANEKLSVATGSLKNEGMD